MVEFAFQSIGWYCSGVLNCHEGQVPRVNTFSRAYTLAGIAQIGTDSNQASRLGPKATVSGMAVVVPPPQQSKHTSWAELRHWSQYDGHTRY